MKSAIFFLPIQEEKSQGKEISQEFSCLERTISQASHQEGQFKPFLSVQHFTYDQVESSLYQSKEDTVKKFFDERNLSLNESYKLMQGELHP